MAWVVKYCSTPNMQAYVGQVTAAVENVARRLKGGGGTPDTNCQLSCDCIFPAPTAAATVFVTEPGLQTFAYGVLWLSFEHKPSNISWRIMEK